MRAHEMLDEWRQRLSRAESVLARPVRTLAERGRYLAARISLPVLRYLVRRYSRSAGDDGAERAAAAFDSDLPDRPGGVSASTPAGPLGPGRPARSRSTIRSALGIIHGDRKPLVQPGPDLVIGPDHLLAVEHFDFFLVALEFKFALRRRRIPCRMSWSSEPWVVYAPRRDLARAMEIYDRDDFRGVDAKERVSDSRMALRLTFWSSLIAGVGVLFLLNLIKPLGQWLDDVAYVSLFFGLGFSAAYFSLYAALQFVVRWYIIRGRLRSNRRLASNRGGPTAIIPEPR